MKISLLALSILLTSMLIGSISAQPMDESRRTIAGYDRKDASNPDKYLLTDDLCNSPISMSGSPTEVRSLAAGTCVEIFPSFPQDTSSTCFDRTCSVNVFGPGGFIKQMVWHCRTGAVIGKSHNFCFCVGTDGDYTFYVDVCLDENGTIECSSCSP